MPNPNISPLQISHRATPEQMRNAAAAADSPTLVSNAQPMSSGAPPKFDSNV